MIQYNYEKEQKPQYSVILQDKMLDKFKCNEFKGVEE